jgi:hypothetical protein
MMARLSMPAVMAAGLLLAACASTGGAGSGSSGSSPSSASSGASGRTGGGDSVGSSRTASAGANGTGAAGAGADAEPAGSGSSGTDATAGTQRAGSADAGAGASTPGERRAGIDSQLDSSLGRFDEQLRREQQRTANERDSHAAARANESVVDATVNSEERREKDRDDIRRDRSGDLQSAAADATGTSTDTNRSMGGNGADARPIPSGADDDIVARRLRRAAETETDPELKEKLWKEYLDYKQNTKSSR